MTLKNRSVFHKDLEGGDTRCPIIPCRGICSSRPNSVVLSQTTAKCPGSTDGQGGIGESSWLLGGVFFLCGENWRAWGATPCSGAGQAVPQPGPGLSSPQKQLCFSRAFCQPPCWGIYHSGLGSTAQVDWLKVPSMILGFSPVLFHLLNPDEARLSALWTEYPLPF